ncbi:MAG: hypothetical protein EU529_04480 [Promethearchaeota archaeon]|nr:MAG: hypothetical protein EU529_04480 [Candidatus Lokiarchaeota archaeon]
MEIDYNNNNGNDIKSTNKLASDLIKVRATLSCPSCSYKKSFKNQFRLKNIEHMIVSLKCFDYMTCSCGELLSLNLDFEI